MNRKQTDRISSLMGWLALLFIMGFTLPGLVQAQYSLRQSVFGNGAGIASSNSNQIQATVGQPFIGTMTNTSNGLAAGFWQMQDYLWTGIAEDKNLTIPIEYQLKQNYPNPFNPSTTIEFALPENSHVSIKLYNVLGKEVATLLEGIKPAGFHKIQWRPERLASGVYFYHMVAKSQVSSRTFTRVKKLAYLR